MPIELKDGDQRFTHIPERDETRMCLDPWSKVFIKINGDVALCCNAPPVGSLRENNLKDILDSNQADKYRRGLLTANLPHPCQVCPDRCTTSKDKLVEMVQRYLDGETQLIDAMESLSQ